MAPLTETKAWKALLVHREQMAKVHLRALFAEDPKRFEKFSIRYDDLLFDYSKNRITEYTLRFLLELAYEVRVGHWIEQMFGGAKINVTEERAVLHTALRNRPGRPVLQDGRDVMPDVFGVLSQMRVFSDSIRDGTWTGHTGRVITDVVNIGIGGSDLGPFMVAEALRPYWREGLRAHFVSNVDGTHLAETLRALDPETTLFLVASKTFTTQETLQNARSARQWLLDTARDEKAIAKHFVAISTNKQAVVEFGIDPYSMFELWDWVGGRYSLWSAIGLSVAVVIGMKGFEELLAGACDIDEHFRKAPLGDNIPVIMALVGLWNQNFLDIPAHAILPYDQYLYRLPAYLQQADMESNGKRIDRDGRPVVGYHTGPILFGEPGTNGQHAFYQLLHQGTRPISADFIAPLRSHNPIGRHHEILLAHFFAQTEALMRGKTPEEVMGEMKAQGMDSERIRRLLAHRCFEGNRPSNSILFPLVTPRALGRLIALYEHKIFVQGVIWNINSFDQYGVELGKQLASVILPELASEDPVASHDSSTNGLINFYKRHR